MTDGDEEQAEPSTAKVSARPSEGRCAARLSDDDVFLWRARRGRGRLRADPPIVHLPGLGPHSTGRTRAQRLFQRVELLELNLGSPLWGIGRRSRLSGGATIADLADGYAHAIRSRFGQPVDVVGESTGGTIALQLARDHPDLVRRLIVVSSASSLSPAGHAAQRKVVDHLRAGSPRRAAAAVLAATTRSPVRSAFLGVAGLLLGRVIVGHGDHDLIVMLEAEDDFDLHEGLAPLAAGTVIIGGSQDAFYSPELFRATADSIPDARYLELEQKGHVVSMTNRAVRRAIKDHLRRR